MFKIFYFFVTLVLLLEGSQAQAAERLEWDAWTAAKPFMKISVDGDGHIEGSFYKEGTLSQNKYYYTDDDYTCAQDLKESFNVNCKNTCFPSYKRKGIELSMGLPKEELQKCTVKKVKRGFLGFKREHFLDFKSETYALSCPAGIMHITLVPKFEKYARFINKSGNTYFQETLKALKLKGFVARITIDDQETKKPLEIYEVKNLVLHKKTDPVSLPKDYLKISTQAFLLKMDELEESVAQFADKKRKLLGRVDSELQNKAQNMFDSGTSKILEELCHK